MINSADRLPPQEGKTAEAASPSVPELQQSLSIRSSPLPSPEELAGYQGLIDNGPERFMLLWEEQVRGRLRADEARVKYETTSKIKLEWGWLTAAVVVVLAFLGAGLALVRAGQVLEGTVVITADFVVSVAAVLLAVLRRDRKT